MTTTKPPPSKARRTATMIGVLLVGTLGLVLFTLGLVTWRAQHTEAELRNLPLTVVRVAPGDTWWGLAGPCGIDRRVAVQWLTATAGVDPAAPLKPDTLALTCEVPA